MSNSSDSPPSYTEVRRAVRGVLRGRRVNCFTRVAASYRVDFQTATVEGLSFPCVQMQ